MIDGKADGGCKTNGQRGMAEHTERHEEVMEVRAHLHGGKPARQSLERKRSNGRQTIFGVKLHQTRRCATFYFKQRKKKTVRRCIELKKKRQTDTDTDTETEIDRDPILALVLFFLSFLFFLTYDGL